jgi:hypothetical protein
MASFAEILQQTKADISSRGSSLSTAAASDECSISSKCSSPRAGLLETASLTSLAVKNRHRAALLQQRLAERVPAAATDRKHDVQDCIEKSELKLVEPPQKIFDRLSLASVEPAPQIKRSVADLRSANDLKTAELRYIMASRRLQTLVDTGVAQTSP